MQRVRSKAARLVSQTQTTEKKIAFGNRAQNQPAAIPTGWPKRRRPSKAIGYEVRLENRTSSSRIATLALKEKAPKSLKQAASSKGNTGVLQAVGPDSVDSGELKPCPVASAAAMLPSSPPIT